MNPKKAVVYCRVSTKEQVEEGNSLATQQKLCNEYALKNGYEIAEIFIEEGESAKTANRTELRRLLEYCSIKKNGITAVIAYKIDRIARNIDDYRQIRLALKMKGVDIKSTSEFFEDTPAGRFMENIIANVAQFDNDVRAERSVGGMREAIRDGRFVWQAPLGYSNAKLGDKSNIVPNNIAPLVRQAFLEVAQGLAPVEDIRMKLTKAGLTTKAGKPISKSSFYAMLRNELYTGKIIGLGERHTGLFEPIIPEALFAQVQRVLKRTNRRATMYKMDHPDFPLRRFIYHCSGTKLTGCWSKGRSKKYAYYMFPKKQMVYPKHTFETLFKDYLDHYCLTERVHKRFKEKVESQFVKRTIDRHKEYKRCQQQALILKEKRQMLIDKNLQGVISDAVLIEQLDIIDIALDKLNPVLSVSTTPKAEVVKLFNEVVMPFLKKPSAVWDKASLECKLKLQWFNFPKGVLFDGKEFQTTEISSLFKINELFTTHLSNVVHPTVSGLNQIPKSPYTVTNNIVTSRKQTNLAIVNTQAYWEQLEQEIVKLSGILQETIQDVTSD